MQTVTAIINKIDPALLTNQLKAALPAKVIGISASILPDGTVLSKGEPAQDGAITTVYGRVLIHLADNVTQDEIAAIVSLAEKHVPVVKRGIIARIAARLK